MAAHGGAGKPALSAPAFALVFLTALYLHAGPPVPGLLPGPPLPSGSARMGSETMRADARLSDVSFVDPQCGWGVGDRGAIWHTLDGGQHWHLQQSGVSCRLESVAFVDRQTGWAAGGFSMPYTHAGQGVLLSTSDGGGHWTQVPGLLLPPLERVRFFDRQHGWAVGCPSAMFPTGVFVTGDGGRSWNPLSGERITTWRGGDLLDRNTGALAGFDGTAATIRRGAVQPARTPRFGLRRVAAVKLVPEVEPRIYGWLVGQGGLLMMTSDLGATWHMPPAELPPEVVGQFDFAAIEVRGPKAWVAGSPGSRILHTADAGRSWTVLPTGQSLPIEALAFADDQHGWAVGHLGTILATSDGGKTWSLQRSGGARAALLGLLLEPDDVPLELLAQLSGDEGYLAAVELLGRRDVETPPRADVPLDDRIHDAVVGVGGCGVRAAWQFPLPKLDLALPPERVLGGWNRVNDGRAIDELDAHLVRQIRLWRPEVVLTHAAATTAGEPVAGLVHEAVLRAVGRAGDPTWHAEQITQLGLEPWKVKRVFGSLGPSARGSTVLATTQLSTRLGATLADAAAGPRGLVSDQFRPAADSLGFQLLVDTSGRPSPRGDFFAGIALAPGGEARRELSPPAADSVDMIRRIAEKRRNSQAILEHSGREPHKALGLLAQVGDLTRELDPNSAGEVLYQLGQRYHQTGNWTLAAETFSRLVDGYPEHPLCDAALVWLVQYYSSGEAAWRVQGGNRMTVQQTSAPAIDPRLAEDRSGQAAAIGKRLETTRPELAARPEIAFPLAVAARRRGFPGDAERLYLSRRLSPTRDAWWACAQGEKWLAEPEGAPPKPLLRCVAATAKPRLDGQLDDPVWQRAQPAELAFAQPSEFAVPPSGGSSRLRAELQTAAVTLAYDAEFLYVAVRCRRVEGSGSRVQGSEPPTPDSQPPPRPRDGDLSAHDRVDVLLDLDRDFATCYRLTVDDRGWPNDSCWGDAAWDPAWFIAAAAEEDAWAAEAAVPLESLTGTFPTSGTIWAIGIQRTVPGVGFQSWNTPADPRVIPEGFGYLLFE